MKLEHGWSLDIAIWAQLSREMHESGITWHVAEVCAGERENIPKKSGVYMFCFPPPVLGKYFRDTKIKQLKMFNVFYVGGSKDLKRRFGEYVRHYEGVKKKKGVKTKSRAITDVIGDFLLNYKYFYPKGARLQIVYAVCKDHEAMEGALMNCFGPSCNQRRVIPQWAKTVKAKKL